MRSAPWFLLLALAGCDEPEAPASCARMCAAASTLYGGCLTDWGVDWTAAGFDDEDTFLNSCSTWGWQMSLLQESALEEGTLDDPGWLDATCTEREAAMSAEDASCSAYTDIEWNNAPWSPEDTGG